MLQIQNTEKTGTNWRRRKPPASGDVVKYPERAA